MAEEDFVDELLASAGQQISGGGSMYEEDDFEEVADEVSGLVEVGRLDEVGAAKLMTKLAKAKLKMSPRRMPVQSGTDLPSPAFARSPRDTARRAPLGFIEDVTGAEGSFTLAAGPGTTTTVRGKVSRVAHINRLLIVPSAPGAVISSMKVGDEEQMLAGGVPVELYGTSALTDSVPDDFSPLQSGIDFIMVLRNTTAAPITGTLGSKATCKR